MRTGTLAALCGLLALAAGPAAAGDEIYELYDAPAYEAVTFEGLGHREPGHRHSHPRPRRHGGAWVGMGIGVLTGSASYECPGPEGGDCSESGAYGTYTANVTVAGPVVFRARGVRTQDRVDGRTPYEVAALVGGRFGRSPWYGLVGGGRVRHADDNVPDASEGVAWEVLFAPGSSGGAGFEMSFHGHLGTHVDFVGFSAGMRFGLLN